MLCEGNACDVVEVTWDERRSAYVFRNHGLRPVQITVVDSAGAVKVQIRAGEARVVYLRVFEYPYSAEYLILS